ASTNEHWPGPPPETSPGETVIVAAYAGVAPSPAIPNPTVSTTIPRRSQRLGLFRCRPLAAASRLFNPTHDTTTLPAPCPVPAAGPRLRHTNRPHLPEPALLLSFLPAAGGWGGRLPIPPSVPDTSMNTSLCCKCSRK